MANRVNIEPTKFVNVRDNSETFGVRVYDDYAQAYDNSWKEIPDNDMDVLKRVLNLDDIVISEMMSFTKEMENGLYIGDEWHEWEEIKAVFEQANEG